jgi:hypothetical protein
MRSTSRWIVRTGCLALLIRPAEPVGPAPAPSETPGPVARSDSAAPATVRGT